MKKFFCFSDAHSFLGPLKKALNEAGFDPNNEDHWLVSCGDLFDRGPESLEMLHFIMSIERKILIKGNHELLLEDCCKHQYPQWHDVRNGTKKTIDDIGDAASGKSFQKCCDITWDKTAGYRSNLVNYFETANYIFVHSWIPTEVTYDVVTISKPWHQTGKQFTYKDDWRSATESDWEEAMWGNPFNLAERDLNKTGKTIVFGHWHCSTGHRMMGQCNDEFEHAIWEPCFYKNTIGIDRCTAHTNEVNVLVLEDNFLE